MTELQLKLINAHCCKIEFCCYPIFIIFSLLLQDFLSAFRKVKEALDTIYVDVCNMNSAVESMTSQLQATKAQTHHLIEQTTKLQTER